MYGQWVRRGNVLMQQIYRSGERFQSRGDVWHREPATIKKSAARTCFQKVLVQGGKMCGCKENGEPLLSSQTSTLCSFSLPPVSSYLRLQASRPLQQRP